MLLIITSNSDGLFRFINIDDLERPWTPKIRLLLNFSQFLIAAHILRMICDEMVLDNQDNLHKKFSALNADFSSPRADLVGSRKPAHASVKLESGYFTHIDASSVKTVADRHRHAAYHNKHWSRAWIPKIGGLVFLAIFGCGAHFKGKLQRNSWK